MIEFAKFSREEQPHVERIVDRAKGLPRVWTTMTRLEITMDLAAVHAKIPLRLQELAEADAVNFAHDMCGIFGHLDRQTGELKDCFVPRFAR
jgi:hypothetical protein